MIIWLQILSVNLLPADSVTRDTGLMSDTINGLREGLMNAKERNLDDRVAMSVSFKMFWIIF